MPPGVRVRRTAAEHGLSLPEPVTRSLTRSLSHWQPAAPGRPAAGQAARLNRTTVTNLNLRNQLLNFGKRLTTPGRHGDSAACPFASAAYRHSVVLVPSDGHVTVTTHRDWHCSAVTVTQARRTVTVMRLGGRTDSEHEGAGPLTGMSRRTS